MNERGKYIAFEGWEASGKSTQARLLSRRLDAVLTREPGGTALGLAVRDLLLGNGPAPTERAEALLFAADRAQHLAEVVEPALAEGRDVITDRSYGSTLAYQGYTADGRLGDQRDRMESEDADFATRVVEGFTALAEADPDRWVVVDGAGSIEEVATRVAKVAGLP